VDSFRTFVAIELPADVRHVVVKHIERLRSELPDIRASWLREDNLHLTLKFLGNVSIAKIADLSSAVQQATNAIKPFELLLSDCGAFPPRGRPNVLWIGVGTRASSVSSSGSPLPLSPSPLSVLHSAIEDNCADSGFPREQRPFHPHLTIARMRQPRGGRELSERHQSLGFAEQRFMVSEVVVFRSELLREGSKHTALSRHALSK